MQRRSKGKSDPLDAYAAADAVISGRATAIAKAGDGTVEAIRVLHLARAIKARTATVNELIALLVTAPHWSPPARGCAPPVTRRPPNTPSRPRCAPRPAASRP